MKKSIIVILSLLYVFNCSSGTESTVGTSTTGTTPGVSYTGSPFTHTTNSAITDISATLTGDTPTDCTSSLTLPTGLSINATTCTISGTPTVSQTATDYTITATNGTGSGQTTINITVSIGTATTGTAPGVNYTGSPFTYPENSAITDISATLTGDAPTSCASSPTLPTGLSIGATSCIISGTPTVPKVATAYTITATNATGTGQVTINVTITDAWAQQAYVKAVNAETADKFGYSVAISGDTMIVGVNEEDSNQTTVTNGATASADNSAGESGAVYVFKRTGTTWAQEAYLKAPNAEASDRFGQSVAISGETIVVGSNQEDSNQTTITNSITASADNSTSTSGAAYVFKRIGTSWAQEAYLKAPNAESNDMFGISVSISGDSIVVGATNEDSNQTTITNGTTASADNSASFSGAAYIFKRTGTTWAQEAYIKAPNAEADDFFGYDSSVAISGDTIVVGAYKEDSNQTTITNGTTASGDNSALSSGAAYVFKRTGTSWAQEAYLKAPNAAAIDFFGDNVSISGDTIVVGARYEDSNQTTITNGATASADNSASASGAAYVFKRTGTSWAQEAYLKAPNAEADDQFGKSVSISGDIIVVGASGEDSNQTTITNGTTASADNSASASGAVYVFKRAGTIWAQQAYLKAPNAGGSDSFGLKVAISGATIVVGANGEDSNQTTITNGSTANSDNSASNSGAAYVFK